MCATVSWRPRWALFLALRLDGFVLYDATDLWVKKIHGRYAAYALHEELTEDEHQHAEAGREAQQARSEGRGQSDDGEACFPAARRDEQAGGWSPAPDDEAGERVETREEVKDPAR